MINTVIVISYDNDSRLGSYFKDCADYAISFLKSPEIISLEITEITGNQCNQAYFDLLALPIINNKNTMLIVYTHGNSNGFLYQEIAFIESTINTHNIKNTVVYTNACSTGIEFGKKISIFGGIFIGYKDDIRIPPTEYCRKLFVECDNSGLFYLLHQKIKLCSLRQAMRAKFDQCIDKIYKMDFFYASCFEEARDNLVVLGQDLDRTII
jgi:hypothetical protein